MAFLLDRSRLDYTYIAHPTKVATSTYKDLVKWIIPDTIDANYYEELKDKNYFSGSDWPMYVRGLVEASFDLDEPITCASFPVRFTCVEAYNLRFVSGDD